MGVNLPDFDDYGNLRSGLHSWVDTPSNTDCADSAGFAADVSDGVEPAPLVISIHGGMAGRLTDEHRKMMADKAAEWSKQYGRTIVFDTGEKGRGVVGKDTNNSWNGCIREWLLLATAVISGAALIAYLIWKYVLPVIGL